MSEELLVRNCAPTLAGIKTGNLFTCPCDDRQALLESLRSLNRRLGSKGVRVLPLRFSERNALIYLYRPTRLKQDLSSASSVRLLERCGYCCQSSGQCLTRLARRLREQEDFPHEIGLFLSYPPEDVQGFMEHRPCKCTGFWKVFENEETAKMTFDRYRKCTKIYCRQLEKGMNIERLTVAG